MDKSMKAHMLFSLILLSVFGVQSIVCSGNMQRKTSDLEPTTECNAYVCVSDFSNPFNAIENKINVSGVWQTTSFKPISLFNINWGLRAITSTEKNKTHWLKTKLNQSIRFERYLIPGIYKYYW
jgi:hypothetical protein